jgi:hypothetical protein
MADAAVPTPQYAAPGAAASGVKEQYVQQTPVWVVVLRALQILFSFVVLIMAGVLIHGHAMAPNGFAVVCVRIAYRRRGHRVSPSPMAHHTALHRSWIWR